MQEPPEPDEPEDPERVKANIARRIKELRSARGMSVLRFAEAMRTTKQYVSKLEGGQENVTIDTMVKVARALRVHTRELLVEPGPPVPYRRGRPRKRQSGREP